MGIKKVHYKNETSITMKGLLRLSFIALSVQCSSALNAADTGYYQNFSTRSGALPAANAQASQAMYPVAPQMPHQTGGGYYGQQHRQQQSQQSQIVMVSNIEAGAHVVLGGTVVADREIILTAQISGRVDYVAGNEGDWFNAGQVLVALNHDDILAQRDQALANLYRTQASFGNTKADYTREYWAPQAYRDYNRRLRQLVSPAAASGMGYFPSMFEKFFSMGPTGGMPAAMPQNMHNSMPNLNYPDTELHPGVVRDLDLYNKENHVNMARSEIMAMQSRINEIDTHLRDARSISPFDGVIVDKLVEAGDTVQRGQPLIKYSDTRLLQLQVEVPARLVSALNTGSIVPAKLDVGNTYIDVRVAQIYPTADSQRHTVTVKFDLPENVPGGPGMYAEVMLPDTNTPVSTMPVIPISAIVRRGSLPAVFVLNNKNSAELRLIRLGDQVDNQNIAVLAGVQPGENVFAYPHPGMRSGWSPQQAAGH
ncbi:MAG TPA: efflux RND transporter periplasmic adaptor subunit [Gammaproteobacteria bacterium]|nr:efflux RND transporter periplasmic adaptor subunit [Gammaproteobacteria bacterium]